MQSCFNVVQVGVGWGTILRCLAPHWFHVSRSWASWPTLMLIQMNKMTHSNTIAAAGMDFQQPVSVAVGP